MKIKGFSILLTLVCIGFVLMFAGSAAHAVGHDVILELNSRVNPAQVQYEVGDEVEVTFTLIENGAPKNKGRLWIIAPTMGVKVSITGYVKGLTSLSTLPDLNPYYETGPTGQVILDLVVTETDGLVTAEYREHNQPRNTVPFHSSRDTTKPILVVLPPQETLYSVEAAPPMKEDGLLRDLPDGFDKTWLGDPTWVKDYCADAERDTRQALQRIRWLADGPRYHKNNRPANAEAYQASVGNLFTAVIEIRDVDDLSAWQMDVAFNPQILRALRVREGKFLAKEDPPPPSPPGSPGSGEYDPFFIPGFINNDVGVITGIAQARVGRQMPGADDLTDNPQAGVSTGANMAGILFCIDFQVLEFAEESLGLHNVQLSNSAGARISYYSVINPVVVTHKFPAQDVNRDRLVGILDLMAVAGAMPPPDGDGGRNLGRANPINPRADVNDDGIVNALDLIAVSSHALWGQYVVRLENRRIPNAHIGPTAPALVGDLAALTPSTIQGWIDIAQVEDDGSAIFDLGIANLERLLQETVPERTKLLLNYPNPFNPETWIPYQLAKATDVSVSIYSVNGALVRTLALGHQAPGVYQSKSQAAYWDGRNELGERVASGVYFYTLTAGDFSATGKMLVRK